MPLTPPVILSHENRRLLPGRLAVALACFCLTFLLIGATFGAASWIQARRGHVAIEAIVGLLSPDVNRVRMLLVDVASLAFCGFFAWKSWTLLHEAVVENFHSGSTWGPPLWIPYSLMTLGMTLLSIQILLQILTQIRRWGTAS